MDRFAKLPLLIARSQSRSEPCGVSSFLFFLDLASPFYFSTSKGVFVVVGLKCPCRHIPLWSLHSAWPLSTAPKNSCGCLFRCLGVKGGYLHPSSRNALPPRFLFHCFAPLGPFFAKVRPRRYLHSGQVDVLACCHRSCLTNRSLVRGSTAHRCCDGLANESAWPRELARFTYGQ